MVIPPVRHIIRQRRRFPVERLSKLEIGRAAYLRCGKEAEVDYKLCVLQNWGAADSKMIQMRFNSVADSEAVDYFQVLFEEEEDNLEAGYFLVQCQFEFPDNGEFYIESNDTGLCGHFEVKTATLTRQCLRLEMPSTKWKIIQVHFATDQAGYEELERVLCTMFEDKLRHAHQDA